MIDGTDFSQAMLDVAAKKPGVYRHLTLGDLNNPIPAQPGDYGQIAAVGVFSPGHAPPEMIPTVMDLLEPGGLFVFSLNDHALEDPGYDAAIEDLAARPAGERGVEVLFREYGEHLPKADLKAAVCVLRRR